MSIIDKIKEHPKTSWLSLFAAGSVSGNLSDYIPDFLKFFKDFNLAENTASKITALASIFIAGQVFYLYKQFQDDHRRSRKEKALDMGKFFSLNINKKSNQVIKLISVLDESQLNKISSSQPFSVRHAHTPLLENCLSTTLKTDPNDVNSFLLDSTQVNELRWIAGSYANILETVLQSWQHHVADRSIIEAGFTHFFIADEGKFMKNFSNVFGKGSFPAIVNFAESVRFKQEDNRRKEIESGKQTG